MDKMREEFEAWHIEQCKADGMDWRDLSSELERDGDEYVYAGAHYAWRGWKASRATLCVELPSINNVNGVYYDFCGYDADMTKEALDKAGVSCK